METRAKDLAAEQNVSQGEDKETSFSRCCRPKGPPDLKKKYYSPIVFSSEPPQSDSEMGLYFFSVPQSDLSKNANVACVPEKHKKCTIL